MLTFIAALLLFGMGKFLKNTWRKHTVRKRTITGKPCRAWVIK
jgi:hypothetical protein